MMGSKKRLSVVAFGVGLGVACALYMLAFIWAGWLGGLGKGAIDMWATVYPGIAPTLFGGIVGAVWGFAKGFVFGVIAAIFYNLCLCCKGCCCPPGKCNCGGNSCDTSKK